MYDIRKGNLIDLLRDIPFPAHCVISRPRHIVLESFIDTVCSIPLLPTGSLWICMREPRNQDGSMSLLPEKIALAMTDRGWYLADKVYWTVSKCTPVGTLKGKKELHHYLGSNGTWIRMTRHVPKETWCNMSSSNNVWMRSLDEESSWYEPFISCTCPQDGLVIDPYCCNEFVAEAAAKLGKKFIGIYEANITT